MHLHDPPVDRLLVPRFLGYEKEAVMFEIIDDKEKSAGDTRELLVKIGLFVAALAALGGVIYFFAFTGMAR